jgi:hypothetical protein
MLAVVYWHYTLYIDQEAAVECVCVFERMHDFEVHVQQKKCA